MRFCTSSLSSKTYLLKSKKKKEKRTRRKQPESQSQLTQCNYCRDENKFYGENDTILKNIL